MVTNNPISKFFNEDYIAFASYDGTRKIASYIDGLKPTARKVIYTVLDKNLVKPDKVDLIKAKVAGHTEYLHGQDAIEGVIVNLAQNFVGACNLPLMTRKGNYGTRLVPDAAASRYIKTCQEDYLKLLFRPEDGAVIGNQEFEGTTIEPKYYVPIIPLLLVNGSEGIAVGYAQRILPRDPKNLMDYIFGGMKDESLLLPTFKGFKGKVVQTDEKSFSIYGCIECKNTTTYVITEVPVGYTYSSYMKVLNALNDSGAIQSFEDYCDMKKDTFEIIVKVRRDTYNKLQGMTQEERLDYFKLVKRVTENYTVLNEDNKIEVFENIPDIIRRYAKVRIDAYQTRKKYIESEMLNEIRKLKSKIIFIDRVQNGELNIKDTPEHELIKEFECNDDIIEVNGSFDYLLNMPIRSINYEEQSKAIKRAKKLAEEYRHYCGMKISIIWKEEYESLWKKLT